MKKRSSLSSPILPSGFGINLSALTPIPRFNPGQRESGGYGNVSTEEPVPFPWRLVVKAEALYPELLNTSTDLYLLHGDLHHGNILYSDSSGWTAIDPKGLIGEREYDCIQFMLNEWKKWDAPLELLRYRTETIASLLSLSYERLLQYGFCHSILSACWSVGDGLDGWKTGVSLAGMFEELLAE